MAHQMLDGVDLFVRIAQRRSFAAGAKDFGISPSAASQRIRALEERVGVPLLVRTTRSVGLTQAGEIFLKHCSPALDEMAIAYHEARNLAEPAGVLRLNMPREVIPIVIEPVLADFCAAYPLVDIEIITSDMPVDLIEEGFDAGIHLKEVFEQDAVGLRLTGPIRFVVVGAPDYFSRYGRPQGISDLRKHDCIRMFADGKNESGWASFEKGYPMKVAVSGRIVVNDVNTCINAARQGLGLYFVVEQLVTFYLANGELEIVLPELTTTSDGIYIQYPNRKHVLPKLRSFINFISDRLKGSSLDGIRDGLSLQASLMGASL